MPRRAALPVALAVAVAMLCIAMTAGCAASGTREPAAVEPVAAPVNTLSLDEIRELGMTMAEKRRVMPPEFPTPVPVMSGEVVEASAAGGVVFYTLETPGSAQRAAEWYRRTYAIANWTPLSERTVPGPDGSIRVLEFEKGDAKSTISVREDGDASIVEGTVSFGSVSSEV